MYVGRYVYMYVCMPSTDNAFIDPPIHITALEGCSEMTTSWNMHGMNLKAVGQRETEREEKKVCSD
jgi:hypothetical protein